MRKLLVVLMAVGLCLGLSGTALADNTADQTVCYRVDAINELSVSGNPGALIVSTANAGSEPYDDLDVATTYAITTNCVDGAKKITAAIGTDMPTGVTLMITLIHPSGGTTHVEWVLSTSAADVVTLIDAVASSGIQLIYKLRSTASAGVVGSAQKTVTLTLTNM